jgi:adenylate cyclase
MASIPDLSTLPPPISRGRTHRGRPLGASVALTPDDVVRWLETDAIRIEDHLELVDQLSWRLVAAGVPVGRCTLHIRTLHPQFLGVTCLWTRAGNRTEELLVSHGARETVYYLDSPMRLVFGERQTVRRRLVGPDAHLDFPMLTDLRNDGLTDYLALPLVLPGGRDSATTFACDAPGGFSEAHVDFLSAITPLLALHVEAHAMRLVATHILDAYLGRNAGRRVLDGRITRGTGETIRAVVWFSDMRNFTALSDRLAPERVIEILNAYFECQAIPIRAAAGEILKFIGDGLLAIFPIDDVSFASDTARRAMAAARATLVACSRLADTPLLAGEKPLRMAIALHIGDVVFGNIGASDRLDFTAIGPAVNLVTRLEGLAKQLGRALLVTENFREAYDRNLMSVGTHSLRGLSQPVQAFTVDDEQALTAYAQARVT